MPRHATGQGAFIGQLLDLYASGHFEESVRLAARTTDAGGFRKQFEREATTWIAAGGQTPRHRLVAASFALEFVRARMDADWITVEPLLEWGCRQLRASPMPGPGEDLWFAASVALGMRGRVGARLLDAHASHAVARFPDDRRFKFRRVVIETFAWAFGQPAGDAVRRFGPFVDDITLAAEAALQISYVYFRDGNEDRALEHARRAVSTSPDPALTFQAWMLIGQAQEMAKRPEEARAAFAAALDALPHAQSAVTRLATLLALDGRQPEAHTLVAASLAAHPVDDDPWRLMDYGDYWRFPALLTSLRTAVRGAR